VVDEPEQPPAPAPPSPPELAEVFGAMRARVGGDNEARAREQYERAVKRLEEGRVDEGLAGLEEAARLPFVRFEAASRLGRLYVERGELARAVDWMERAAEVPPPTPDEGTELRYELADALERVGERARALAILREIEAAVGEFRDVRERIDWLSEIDGDGEHA
jgi:tetratricopeptide (TPR) repeat protein